LEQKIHFTEPEASPSTFKFFSFPVTDFVAVLQTPISLALTFLLEKEEHTLLGDLSLFPAELLPNPDSRISTHFSTNFTSSSNRWSLESNNSSPANLSKNDSRKRNGNKSSKLDIKLQETESLKFTRPFIILKLVRLNKKSERLSKSSLIFFVPNKRFFSASLILSGFPNLVFKVSKIFGKVSSLGKWR